MSNNNILLRLESVLSTHFSIGPKKVIHVQLLKSRPFRIIDENTLGTTGAKGFSISQSTLKDIFSALEKYSHDHIIPEDIPFGTRSFISFQNLNLKKSAPGQRRNKIIDIRLWMKLYEHEVINTSRKDFLIDFHDVDFESKLWFKMSQNMLPTRVFFRINEQELHEMIENVKNCIKWYNYWGHCVNEHMELAKTAIHLIIEENESRTWGFQKGQENLIKIFIENIDIEQFERKLTVMKADKLKIDAASILNHIRVLNKVRC